MAHERIEDIARRHGLADEVVRELIDSLPGVTPLPGDEGREDTAPVGPRSVLHQSGLASQVQPVELELLHGTLHGHASAAPGGAGEDGGRDGDGIRVDAGAIETRSISGVMRSRASDRYERLGLIGVGGMGEVRRVRDRDLNRVMAMKVVRKELLEQPGPLSRFIEEAQATAQLQHPGIVPVHELGRLADGRFYFTMKEVKGRTLGDVIQEVHRASKGDRWEPGPAGWTFRRLVDAFHKACEAVAYAHSRGVIHRDLKPDNIMVGEHGEVLVVDWGLAKVLDRPDQPDTGVSAEWVVTDRSQDDARATRLGAVAGTPAYMPPEQARGEVHRLDPRSDVYALGAILYEVLSGRPPYQAEDGGAVLRRVLEGPPDPPGRLTISTADTLNFDVVPARGGVSSGPPLPDALVEVCLKSMSRGMGDRFADAAAVAKFVATWMDGATKRDQAIEVVEKARALAPAAEALRLRAQRLRGEAQALLEPVAPWAPADDKAPGWAKEDEAAELEARAQRMEHESVQLLHAALTHAPDVAEAHRLLAARYHAEHAVAEARRDDAAAARPGLLLRAHALALPETDRDRARHLAYLKGDGTLTLFTNPAGAEVRLFRYDLRDRRLAPAFVRSLGPSPITKASLPMGTYLLQLVAPGHAPVLYPVHIGRQEHWRGAPPEASDPAPIHLPAEGDLEPDDVYVPQGWFWAGGDAESPESLPLCRLWCDAFVMKRFPVTNREYIEFLDALAASGREADALRYAPRERAAVSEEEGSLIYGRDAAGRFLLRPGPTGDAIHPDWPVTMVDWACAVAYCRWLSERTGLPWRLPGELEFEKAARGVDGRFRPWGDFVDPSWCCMRDSHQGRQSPAVVDSFPVDESVYGVRGMGGNVRIWCGDAYSREGPPTPGGRVSPPALPTPAQLEALQDAYVSARGCGWSFVARNVRLANRVSFHPSWRSTDRGFRPVRSL